MNNQLRNLFFIWSMILLSIILTVIPVPDLLDQYRLPWLKMTVIFFSIFNISLIGIISVWFSGLILDIMTGGLMGENALILAVLSYLSYRFRFQIRVYPMWQIMLIVLMLLSLGELISLWINGVSGTMSFNIYDWINVGIAVLVWPIFMRVLEKMQSLFLE
jgi:rod shape-determining protein MreD|tara:strand:+ start:398 stop:880 length:483 start_codon:yes stop_codon:yes gene_type:complete